MSGLSPNATLGEYSHDFEWWLANTIDNPTVREKYVAWAAWNARSEPPNIWRLRAEETGELGTQSPLAGETLPPSATASSFKEIGVLHRPRTGEVHFIQQVFSIPLPVHGTLTVYLKDGE